MSSHFYTSGPQMLTSSHCLLQSSAASLILFTWGLIPASESTEAVYSVNLSRDDLVSSVSSRYSTNFVRTLSFGTPHNVTHVNALICPEMEKFIHLASPFYLCLISVFVDCCWILHTCPAGCKWKESRVGLMVHSVTCIALSWIQFIQTVSIYTFH